MKRRMNSLQTRKMPSTFLFMFGYLAGMLLPNLIWKPGQRNEISSAFIINTLQQARYIEKSFIFEIWKQKGCYYLLTILSGFTIFGVPLAVMEMILLGFFSSAILTVSIFQFGIYGVVVTLGLMLPQYLFYYPVCFILLPNVYHQSFMIWKRRGALPERISTYALCILFATSLGVIGTMAEISVNPLILRWILKTFPIYSQLS